MYLIILLYAFLASSFTICKYALNIGVSPVFFMAVRMFLAGSLLLSFWYLFKKQQKGSIRDNLSRICLYSVIGMGTPFIVGIYALSKVSSVRSGLIANFVPLFATIFAYFMIGEKISKKKIIGLFIGLCGFLPIIIRYIQLGSFSRMGVWDLIFIFVNLTYAYGWVEMKAMVRNGLSPIWINGVAMLFTGVVSALFSLKTGMGTFESWTQFIILVTIIIITTNFIALVGLSLLLKKYSVTFIALSHLMIPVFVAIYGYIFLGEYITWHFLVSIFFVGLGLYIFNKEET